MSPGRRAVWLLVAACAAAPRTQALELATERSRVLTSVGPVKELQGGQRLLLQPLDEGIGLVFVRDVREPGARGLRLHFTVEGPPDPAWAIQVKDAAGRQAWSASPDDGVGASFWSDEIAGERARVEVYSTRRANPVLLAIDRIAIRNDKVKPFSITGRRNDLKSIRGQDDWIVERGRSVARIRFVADGGGAYSCTAFLVTRQLLLTNQHCIASDPERASALVDFDYDAERLTKRPLKLGELLHTSYALDYALLRLQAPVDREPLRLDSSHPPEREQLLVIQHPGGEPKQVSLRDCLVDGASTKGREQEDSDFGHQCDTLTGSSGSPVFRLETRGVVGLHHLAYDAASLFNRAVHVDRILADLPEAHRAEVQAGQPR